MIDLLCYYWGCHGADNLIYYRENILKKSLLYEISEIWKVGVDTLMNCVMCNSRVAVNFI